jgi:hypothetical protein
VPVWPTSNWPPALSISNYRQAAIEDAGVANVMRQARSDRRGPDPSASSAGAAGRGDVSSRYCARSSAIGPTILNRAPSSATRQVA